MLAELKSVLGWREKLAAWLLWSWAKNGGALMTLDKFPGVKTYLLAGLMVVAGIGGCAACVVRWLQGETDAWAEWAAAYAMLHLGLIQITQRLAIDRQAREQMALAMAALAAAKEKP